MAAMNVMTVVNVIVLNVVNVKNVGCANGHLGEGVLYHTRPRPLIYVLVENVKV